jgi:SET domain-containing protein
MIKAVSESARVPQRAEYAGQTQHPLRCAIFVTRPIREGMEILVNYAWSLEEQGTNRCGYDYYAEQNGLSRGEGQIEDEDIISSSRKR